MTKQIRPCARCGIKRQARANAVLCRDCREVLTREENALWIAQAIKDRIRFHERRIDALRSLV